MPSSCTAHAQVKPDGESAVFVTSAGGRTALHQDDYHNTLLHLDGIKRVVLIDPRWLESHSGLLRSLFTKPGTHEALYEENHQADQDDMAVLGLPRLTCSLDPGGSALLLLHAELMCNSC